MSVSQSYESVWLGHTILLCKGVLKSGTMRQIIEHSQKKGKEFWINNTILDEETGEEVVDKKHKRFQLADESKLINKVYEAIDDTINECVGKYLEKFKYFEQVLTGKEEYNLIRYKKGGFQEMHVDVTPVDMPEQDDEDEEEEEEPEITQENARKLAIYIYLNDDYEGGNIVFPYQKVDYKPTKGDVLVFDCGCLHPHSCEKVKEGEKYVVVNWMF